MTTGRDATGLGWRLAVSAAAAALVASGCGVLPAPSRTDGPCPDGWQAAVLWSTQNGSASTLSYVLADGSVEERNLPYLGFETAGAGTIERRGTDTVMVSNGDMNRDRTHIVTLSETCQVTAVEVDEAVVLGVATSTDAVFTTGWLNGAGWIHRHDPDGTTTELSLAGTTISKPVADGGKVYAFATSDTDGSPLLLVLDATSLVELDRVPLRDDTGEVINALVKDGMLYYPFTGPADDSREGDSLGIIDLDTLQQTALRIEAPSPYLLAATDDAIYVGHSFMNSSYRPMNEYVWVTRYDPATKGTQTFDVGTAAGIGINDIATNDTGLFVLGTTGDTADGATLLVHDPETMAVIARTVVPVPGGPGHHYVAGLVVP
jgi:hypothetical protein